MSPDFMAAVAIHSNFRAQVEEICPYLHFFPFYLPWSNRARCHDLSFFNIFFHSPPSPSLRGSLVPLSFLPFEWFHLRFLRYWCFSHLYWFQLVAHPARHFSWCAQHVGQTNRVTADSPVALLSLSRSRSPAGEPITHTQENYVSWWVC